MARRFDPTVTRRAVPPWSEEDMLLVRRMARAGASPSEVHAALKTTLSVSAVQARARAIGVRLMVNPSPRIAVRA